ncbi:MAG: PhzF family phenazine biosynthesis protein [Marinibacterium sp.]|nr:PhzF family phenazine biosynthesis protein [Marinibacterium sp.]
MTTLEFDWVDAFSDVAFGGNGCAVVHGGAALPDEVCLAYVRETSLVECTFTGPSELADVRVRYFLATREIPFAGHPTIATVAALKARGYMTGDRIVLETGAGLVPVTLTEDGLFEMTQIAPRFGLRPDPALVARAIGLPEAAIAAPPQFVSTGLPFCITLLRHHGDLRQARLDAEGLRDLAALQGFDGSDMAEPFLVTLEGATGSGQTFSRLLLAPPSPPEDPFTGSATGAMASYLWHNGLLEASGFVAEQGHWMGRPGQARVSRVGSADQIEGVRVAGAGYVLMSGAINLPG